MTTEVRVELHCYVSGREQLMRIFDQLDEVFSEVEGLDVMVAFCWGEKRGALTGGTVRYPEGRSLALEVIAEIEFRADDRALAVSVLDRMDDVLEKEDVAITSHVVNFKEQ